MTRWKSLKAEDAMAQFETSIARTAWPIYGLPSLPFDHLMHLPAPWAAATMSNSRINTMGSNNGQ
jgi:hypothetical protein